MIDMPEVPSTALTLSDWRSWFRERHAPRDRRQPPGAPCDPFAVTEWAETMSGVGVIEDPLAPPLPLRVTVGPLAR
jgi:hypothetical protein